MIDSEFVLALVTLIIIGNIFIGVGCFWIGREYERLEGYMRGDN